MDCDQEQISFSIDAGHCILRLAGALGVASAEELSQAALELCAYRKNLVVDWSGATQLDAGVAQVLQSLRAGLSEPDQSWLDAAGLISIPAEAVEVA